jgi:ferredoxin
MIQNNSKTPPPGSPSEKSDGGDNKNNITETVVRSSSIAESKTVSAIAAMATALLLFIFVSGGNHGPWRMYLSVLFALLGAAATFRILRTGRVNHIRRGIFILSGIAFTIVYSLGHQIHRGSILMSEQILNTTGTAPCPITIPFVVPPYALLHKLIFSTTEAQLLSVVFMWLGLALILGRGWCSWICFFGWIDQFFSSLLKEPVIKIERVPEALKLFPYALMLFLILASLTILHPIFCDYMCPLRMIYDPPTVNTTVEWILALIFVTCGLIFLVIGPLLTKKRIFCSYICPLIPLNSIAGLISPFKVKVDTSRCKDCGLCIKSCELGAITRESLAKGGTTIECSRCGKCMDICPAGAIGYRLIWADEKIRPWFIAVAVVLSLMMLAGFISRIIEYLMIGDIRGF